jgi:3'-phosphoadenosine 5'-phosphosulfate sulfotransferase (PAPS reductase)/FAD synthetase
MKKQLFNSKPITLLNVTYKIFAKAFQMQMQLVLMEAISQDQSTFLPFRFILNTILLIHETITWVKKSKQPLILLKLNFYKAYDKVDWRFLFNYMDKLEIPTKFVNMTKMFL